MLQCFLIGADTLLIECGEALLRHNHRILGVITSTGRIADWAQKHGIPVHDAKSDYKSALEAQAFDYLFSITHLAMIPGDVLMLPRCGAINFHDGPLPHYAGLNAPAWALIHRAPNYGVTWHQMTAAADEGDILKQVLFDIAPDETSLTINTKCFQAAIESFEELVREIDAGTEVRRAQDLSERTYFGKFQRPTAACFVDWTQPADQLEAFVRALDFGRYWNPLGLPKVQYNRQVVAIRRATSTGEITPREPGTVVGLTEETILVATSLGCLAISEFATLSGRPLSPKELTEHWGLQVGERFETLVPEEMLLRTELADSCYRSESFWLRRLKTIASVDLIDPSDAERLGNAQFRSIRGEVPAAFRDRFADFPIKDTLTVAWTAYLARTSGQTQFDVGFRDERIREQIGDCGSWISPQVPVRASWNLELTFAQGLSTALAELQTVRRHGPWLWDLIGRASELRDLENLATGRLLPTAVEQFDSDETTTPPSGVTLSLCIGPDGRLICTFDNTRISEASARATLDHFLVFLDRLTTQPTAPLSEIDILTVAEKQLLLETWNDTETPYESNRCVHEEFERQVRSTPDATALVFESHSLSYRELDERANQLAAYLRLQGVGPDRLVGICLDRSLDLVVAVLATHKAGGAYVPLDPTYPRDRLAYMLQDAQVVAVVIHDHLQTKLPEHSAKVVRIDADWPQIIQQSAASSPHSESALPHNLAYVIYTSGSTGKPKGVMVEHRNVLNFFAGMDQRIEHDPPGTWLAVTSLSFDISVLELLWTLSRGFRVVIYRDRDRELSASPTSPSLITSDSPAAHVDRPIDFSLFYFSSSEQTDPVKYQLLLEGSRFADENDFCAVWTPERHFNAFGGLYPNPSVTGAAIAVTTKRLQIRAGSVVLPLHHPARVAEEWSVVDNLSNGRVAISIAAGWQPNDFLLRPESFAEAKKVMFRDIETIKRLWRGEAIEFLNGQGQPVAVSTHPRPVQAELPVWVTTAGNIETYRMAGEIGANVLTHLLGQSIQDLAPKIAAYRKALAENGFDPKAGIVSLMLHTYVTDNAEQARETVREPLRQYLSTALNLLKQYAWSFPAFRRPANINLSDDDVFAHLTDEERDALLEHAFERYYDTSGLFGRPQDCLDMINELKAIGVDDIACLIDFGVSTDQVLASLPYLNQLRKLSQPAGKLDPSRPSPDDQLEDAKGDSTPESEPDDFSLLSLVQRHHVTHLQCTPSMARMLVHGESTREALRQIRHLLIGGEAFPIALAKDLDGLIRGSITNMYGPTETTVWSSTQTVVGTPKEIFIGRPIANTQCYILDEYQQLVPAGQTGELYIGGASVTRGYLHRPDLTASRFLKDPFRTSDNARIYRTGDLARFQDDGTIEFLGRTDHQVKIRGYRIELGEIESLLGQHPEIREQVVIAREDQPGDQRLTAYYVGKSDPPSAEVLRQHLQTQLPEYMVPSQWIALDALPLTPNGKIDRKALPAPDQQPAATKHEYVAPKGELQEKLAELWKSVLGRKTVGVDDNFFDLGGHSLLVVILHRQLREQINQPLSLTDLYRFPTIRTLADHLAADTPEVSLQQSVDRAQRRLDAIQRRRGPRSS